MNVASCRPTEYHYFQVFVLFKVLSWFVNVSLLKCLQLRPLVVSLCIMSGHEVDCFLRKQ